MKLAKFRVTDFRSVDDSGWIETDDVTALVGMNESGKTNLLLPLWKLNPAKEGAITPTADFPRKQYSDFRSLENKPVFIRAVFHVDDALAEELANMTGVDTGGLREVEVSRDLDGVYSVDFPNAVVRRTLDSDCIITVLDNGERDISGVTALRTEVPFQEGFICQLRKARESIPKGQDIGEKEILGVIALLQEAYNTNGAPKTSKTIPRYQAVCAEVRSFYESVTQRHPRDCAKARDLILEKMPKFVYYSSYGNLDSEIYLPHVIADMKRQDLGQKKQAKVRTLKVLFEFVNLQPEEIHQLGQDIQGQGKQPTDEEIAIIAEQKRERSILLQSASAKLTKEFRDWWEQGEYVFRFEADGDHFRIWVSDDKRPEEIELEGRSTGLQWFLSFYLVFLVERANVHEGAILLLDEPGLSLHPIAQRDLSKFFNGLSTDNQLIYTCHSPFLVDPDRLDRVRKVYVAPDGTTKATANLAEGNADGSQRGSAYAVHAALGLSVAESLLLGCVPIIVEGPSDQHYLTAIKNVLIAAGRLSPGRELIFPPAGGTKGVRTVASILAGRDEELPAVFLDSDTHGRSAAESLRNGLYADRPDLVIQVESLVDMPNSEIEDLIPREILVSEFNRWQRSVEVSLGEDHELCEDRPIVGQIEDWAKRYSVELAKPGWKVELAKRVKQKLLDDGPVAIDEETLDTWTALFQEFESVRAVTTP